MGDVVPLRSKEELTVLETRRIFRTIKASGIDGNHLGRQLVVLCSGGTIHDADMCALRGYGLLDENDQINPIVCTMVLTG